MKIVLIGNPKSYENKRLAEEFTILGHEFTALSIKRDIMVEVHNNTPSFVSLTEEDLFGFDLYIFRGLGDAVWEMMVFAKHLHNLGKVIVEEKLATERALMTKLSYTLPLNGIPVIDHRVIFSLYKSEEEIDLEKAQKLAYDYPFIMKSTEGSRGRGVFKVDNFDQFIEQYKLIGPKVLIQKYLPIKFDYRVFIVGGKALGVLKRYNSEENFLTNVSAGGTTEASSLPQEVVEMCVKAAAIRKTEIAGVDVIEFEGKYYVLEINTSPQFQGFETTLNINVAEEIAKYCISKASK